MRIRPSVHRWGALFAHAWPTLPCSPDRYKQVLNFDLNCLPLGQQMNLLGDGMALQCSQAWLLYILTHTVRRVDVEGFKPHLEMSEVIQSWDDDSETG